MSYDNTPPYELMWPRAYGAGFSEAGVDCPTNTDNYIAEYNLGTFGVFSGVGTPDEAAYAASSAAHEVYEQLGSLPATIFTDADAQELVKRSLSQASAALVNNGQRAEATADIVMFYDNDWGARRATIGHVGDNRVYLLRRGWQLGYLTLDNSSTERGTFESRAWELQSKTANALTLDRLTSNERAWFNRRNMKPIDTLGNPSNSLISDDAIKTIDVQEGDRLLLTTDGVHDNLATYEIEQILQSENDPATVAHALVAAAKVRSNDPLEPRAMRDSMTAVAVNIP